jgi:hypothetical protein
MKLTTSLLGVEGENYRPKTRSRGEGDVDVYIVCRRCYNHNVTKPTQEEEVEEKSDQKETEKEGEKSKKSSKVRETLFCAFYSGVFLIW